MERIDDSHLRWRGSANPARTDTALALNVVVSALAAHSTLKGAGAFDDIDVELLFSCIQALGDRDGELLAPFVEAWKPGLDSRAWAMPPIGWERGFIQSLDPSSASLWRRFAEGVDAVVSANGSEVFQRLQSEMLEALRDSLRVDVGASDYLAPLLDIGDRPAQIATLNYDMSVEVLAQSLGRSLSTGAEAWSSGLLQWTWDEDAEVRLLKLHGSLDWQFEHEWRDNLRWERLVVGGERHPLHRPALIFGQRGKLRSDGPFLAMLAEFERFLSQTERLIVIGYSFRDDHINALIQGWLGRGPAGGITIIAPELKWVFGAMDEASGFLRGLLSTVTESSEGVVMRPVLPHRLVGLKAAEALAAPESWL